MVARHAEHGHEKGSLERGLTLLRLFRPGVSTLGNGELAERSGMARSTVTRITHQMVQYGFLQKVSGGFKLAPVVLSMAEAYTVASPVLKYCQPVMQKAALQFGIDVNLAMLDGAEMVYIETIRHRKEAFERRVRPGHRIPLELTSAGKTWLAGLPIREFQQRLDSLAGTASRRDLRREIVAARREFQRHGYCTSQWMSTVVAIAAPLEISANETFYISFSASSLDASAGRVRSVYGPNLLALSERICRLCGEQ